MNCNEAAPCAQSNSQLSAQSNPILAPFLIKTDRLNMVEEFQDCREGAVRGVLVAQTFVYDTAAARAPAWRRPSDKKEGPQKASCRKPSTTADDVLRRLMAEAAQLNSTQLPLHESSSQENE